MLMDGGDGRRALVSLRENPLVFFFCSHPGSVSLMTAVYTVTSDLRTGSNRAKTCRVRQ